MKVKAVCIGYASHHNHCFPDWECAECNKEVKQDYLFCPNCGNALEFPKIDFKDKSFGYHRIKC